MRRWIALTGVVLGLGGCGTQAADAGGSRPTGRVVLTGAGVSIRVPAHWHLARRLTALAEPRERLTIASYPLPAPPPAERDCGPRQAVMEIPPDGALAFLFEYRRARAARFPARPRHFRFPATAAASYDCFQRGWLLRFREHGRAFQVMLAAGPRSARNRVRLLAALDTIRIDPAPKAG